MRNYKPMAKKVVCCLYCKKEFVLNHGQQRWHDCSKAVEAKRIIMNERANTWKKKINYRKPGLESEPVHFGKKDWKLCKKCRKVLTPNYFGTCSNCLDIIESKYDLDMIMDFESGQNKRTATTRMA